LQAAQLQARKLPEIPENSLLRYSISFLILIGKDYLPSAVSIVVVEFDINESEGKHVFRKYDNGQYQKVRQ
jgi:hypothetical protein